MVKNYTDSQILERVRSLPSFKYIPTNYWLVGIRSEVDTFNKFDDKLYLWKGDEFIDVWKATTNAGDDMLKPSNSKGEAVLKANEIYYDSHERRLHRGKVMAYCQAIPLLIYRDNDRDRKTEELGASTLENIGINIHPASYQYGSNQERTLIGGWSYGCSVFSIRSDFDKFMKLLQGQKRMTYCLLNEW